MKLKSSHRSLQPWAAPRWKYMQSNIKEGARVEKFSSPTKLVQVGPALGPMWTMCKIRVTPPPPASRQAEVVHTTIDQSQSFLHISVNQHVALMATTVGLVAVLLLCLALYCIKPYITRCVHNLVSQEEDHSTARNSARAFAEGSYPLNTVSRARGPLGSDTQSRI